MRPYRAIPIDGKDFVYGWYVELEDEHYIIPDTASICYGVKIMVSEYDFIEDFVKVIPETVGQQTGFTDINNKEAYDGHIISVIAEKHLIDGKYVGCVPFNAKVFWEPNMLAWFYEELEYGEGGHPLANCKCEIIGNVHQPELLKK